MDKLYQYVSACISHVSLLIHVMPVIHVRYIAADTRCSDDTHSDACDQLCTDGCEFRGGQCSERSVYLAPWQLSLRSNVRPPRSSLQLVEGARGARNCVPQNLRHARE